MDKDVSSCPFCFSPKSFIEEVDEKINEQKNVFLHAVKVSEENPGIMRDNTKCIDCGLCRDTCKNMCGLDFLEDTSRCLSCGQCVLTCPTNALKPKNSYLKIKLAYVIHLQP